MLIQVEAAIEALTGVGDVTVDVELLDEGDGGRVFTVAWPTWRGDVPLLRVNGSGLTPAADAVGASEAAVAYVNEVSGTELAYFLHIMPFKVISSVRHLCGVLRTVFVLPYLLPRILISYFKPPRFNFLEERVCYARHAEILPSTLRLLFA